MILSLSTEDHARILDALPAQLAVLSSDGTIRAVNESWKRFVMDNSLAAPGFGVGMKYLDLCQAVSGLDEKGARDVAEGIHKVLRGEVAIFEIEHPCLSAARRRWIQLTATPLRKGEEQGAVVMHLDITERKQSEDRLKRSARQLLQAQQVAGVGSWERDLLDNSSTWSDEFIRILGLDPQTIAPALDIYIERVHPDDRAIVRDVLERIAKGLGPIDYECRIVQPKGAIRFIHCRGELILGPEGTPIRTVGTVQDITERKVAEIERARLLRSEQAARAQAEEAIERLHAIQSVTDATLEEVREGRERLRALSRRLVDLQESERREIARELHDEIGQLLTGVKLLIETGDRERVRLAEATREGTRPGGTARRSPGAKANVDDTEAPLERRSEVATLVNEIMGRVRDLSMNLRPAMLDDLGLLPALRWHFARYTAQTHVRVSFDPATEERRFPAEIEIAAFRITQEALTNVARHAAAQDVTVAVEVRGGILYLRIEDHGAGFDPAGILPGASSGITGMLERARLVGGSLTIQSRARDGTRILAELPISIAAGG